MEKRCFEQGPIRPPSEARSLLIRATRNCPWNKCAFCHTYQGERFSLRSAEEVIKDIEAAKTAADDIKTLSWRLGNAGEVTEGVVRHVYNRPETFDDGHRTVAVWLYYGGRTVFLQDADSLIMKTDDLEEILLTIRRCFPSVDRVTSYCRSKTAARKTVEDLRRLKRAGLSRIHIGMESGSDEVLAFIHKGVTAEEHIAGGRKVKEAGISLSEYVIPGLGGVRWSREHAEETGKVISAINPDFVRLRSLQIVRGTMLHERFQKGEFTPLNDEDVLKEIRLMIERFQGIDSTIVSDHILNLLEEVEGKLPEDKEYILGVIDDYFALPEEDRLIFRIGRRSGVYRRLSDLGDAVVYDRIKSVLTSYKGKEGGALERDLRKMMHHYI